jgi:hypothetical protein
MNVAGAGWLECEQVQISFNGFTLCTDIVGNGQGTCDGDYGALFPGACNLPNDVSNGTYPVTALGLSSGITVNTTYTVAGGFTLSPSSGNIGTSVSIIGSVYGSNESVQILFNSVGPGTGNLVRTVTTSGGGIFATSFTVPSVARPRCYAVLAYGVTSQTERYATYCVN